MNEESKCKKKKTIQVLEENSSEFLFNVGVGKGFLTITQGLREIKNIRNKKCLPDQKRNTETKHHKQSQENCKTHHESQYL